MLNVNIKWDTNNITNVINIFDNYIKIANSFYLYSNNERKRIWLFTYSKILNKFIKIIENNYFKEKKNNLLVIEDSINIPGNDILKLEKDINIIINFFKKYKSVLSSTKSTKDKFLIEKLYPNLEKTYTEFFYALKDYDEYLAIYDKIKEKLLTTKSINENINNEKELSIDKAEKYLKFFNWIQFKNTNIKLMDYRYCLNPNKENESIKLKKAYCYKIDNLIIDRQNISFILYPILQNKITNIKIWNKDKVWTYRLDNIKIELDKKLKTIKKDREQYMFKNFLLNTFSRKEYIDNNNNTEHNDIKIVSEDSVIRTFKRNKLLWELWDFSKISSIIQINYNDLKVIREWDNYNIYIDWSLFNIKINKNETYRWYISSDYNFSNKHSFINPKLKLIEKKSEKDLLLWNYIYIKWEYKVNNIWEGLKELLSLYKEIEFIIKNIAQNTYNNDINIYYNNENKWLEFKTLYNEKNIYIKVLNNKIISTKYNWNEILENSIDYKLLPSIFNKITK